MWIFSSKHDGQERQTDLTLDWQVNGTALSNHHTPQETDATELWQIWLERYGRRDHPELGAGWVPIYWYIRAIPQAMSSSPLPLPTRTLCPPARHSSTTSPGPKTKQHEKGCAGRDS